MACIERRPRCGTPTSPLVPEPLARIGSVIGTGVVIAGAAGGILKALQTIGGIGISLGAFSSGAIAAAIAVIAILILIALYIADRCIRTAGLPECLAGVVQEIVRDFSSFTEGLLPFTAMHARVDVVVKSRYWDVVQDGGANVFCTTEIPPRRSEIIRCYFFTNRVCNAGNGSLYGAIVGGVGGIIAAAFIAAAITCGSIYLCVVALIVAVLVATIAALIGAFAGGQIGRAASSSTTPSDSAGEQISVGNLITVKGNMVRREFDAGANVLWWVESPSLHGKMSPGAPSNPFSYCEVDDEFVMDSCPRA